MPTPPVQPNRPPIPTLAERPARAKPGDISRILAKAGTYIHLPGDDLPPDWPAKPA